MDKETRKYFRVLYYSYIVVLIGLVFAIGMLIKVIHLLCELLLIYGNV